MESFAEDGSKYRVMEELAGEVQGLLEDLGQSGFDTIHDSTLEGLRKAAELTEQYGMAYLSGLLSGLEEEACASRHRMDKERGRMTRLYTDILEYLFLCGEKAAYDRGMDYYCGNMRE